METRGYDDLFESWAQEKAYIDAEREDREKKLMQQILEEEGDSKVKVINGGFIVRKAKDYGIRKIPRFIKRIQNNSTRVL